MSGVVTAVSRSPDGTPLSHDSRCSLAGNNSIQCQLVKDYTASGELKNGIRVPGIAPVMLETM